jgi:hypothetical protein
MAASMVALTVVGREVVMAGPMVAERVDLMAAASG